MSDCPCCSGKTYATCCEPVIAGMAAQTAEALMRSRYTAYHNGIATYIQETTHPSRREDDDLGEIEQWAAENAWLKLEIFETLKGTATDTSGIVEFKAHFKNAEGQPKVHHERSNFVRENDHWYYVNGKTNLPARSPDKKIQRNAPCPCGSGKKYKHCCA